MPRTLLHSRRRRSIPALLFAAVILACIAPSAASAANVVGPRWPGTTIRYYETLHPSYDWSLAAATNAWNRTGIRTRFVRVTRRSQAQLVIRMGSTGNVAYATIGSRRGATLILRGRPGTRLPAANRVQAAVLLAHELGHVLGLGHTRARGCTLMQPTPRQCEPSPLRGRYGCRLVRRDDLVGALRLYGGRARAVPRDCLIDPVAPPLRQVAFSGGEATSTPVRLTWIGPARRPPVGSKIVVRAGEADDCARTGPTRSVTTVELGVATRAWTDSASTSLQPGARCYQLQLVNMWGLGATPVRRSITTWAPAPATPVVGAITRDPASFDPRFRVPVTLDSTSFLRVERRPAGACATVPSAEGPIASAFQESPGNYVLEGIPAGSWCLSFFAINEREQASSAATVELLVA